MSQRLYLTNAASSYNPGTTKGAWDDTAGMVGSKLLGLTKTGTQTSNTVVESSTTNNYDVAIYQFVSEPMEADQTIDGTIDYVVGCLENNPAANDFTHLHIWVTEGNSSTVRGTLLTDHIGATEWVSAAGGQGRGATAVSLSSVAAQTGDRIVVEVGYRAVNTSATGYSGTVYIGGTPNDLAINQVVTSSLNSGWIQFNTNLPVNLSATEFQVATGTSDARNVTGSGTYNDTVVTQHLGKFSATTSYVTGLRFPNVTVPNAATITNAYVTLYSAGVTAGTTAKTTWTGDDADNSAVFSSSSKPEDRTDTTASTNKDFTVSGWTTTGFKTGDTVDVTAIVQEIVDRAGWVAGNYLSIICANNASSNTNYIGISTYDSAIDRGAKLTVEYTVSGVPDDPSSFTATQSGANINLAWTDNSSNEDRFVIQRKRGSSPTWYTIATTAADATSATDTDVDPGYTYYYQIRAESDADGNSNWVAAASSVTMTGSKAWTARNMASLYPGATNADEEYSDGRVLHYLKPRYYQVDASGALDQLVDPTDGANGYSVSNAADVIANSEKQLFSVYATAANTATLVNDSGKRSTAISDIVAFLATSGFTGVEIDFNGHSSWSSTTYGNYKTFVTDLVTAVHAVNKLVMIVGPAITNSTEQASHQWLYSDFESIDVDFIGCLLYNYQNVDGGGASVQPLSWMRDGIEWVRGQITDIDRIVIFTPTYGYHATTGGFSITIDTKTESEALPAYGTATLNADKEMGWVNAGISYKYQDTASMNAKREAIEDEGVKYISAYFLGGNEWYDAYDEIAIDDGRIAIISDTFNRTNADDIGSSDGSGLLDPFDYDDSGDGTGFEVSSNTALSHDNDSGIFFPSNTVTNGLIEAELTPVATEGVAGIICRISFDTGDGYALLAFEDSGSMSLSLFEFAGFAPDTAIWNSAGTYALGSKVGLQYNGTTFNVYVNDVDESGDISNSHVTVSGNDGVFGDSGSFLDNLAYYGFNQVPIATAQTVDVTKDIPEQFTLSGTDADGDSLEYTVVTLPGDGDLTSPSVILSTDTFNRSNGNAGNTDGAGSLDPLTWEDFGGGQSSSFQISSNQLINTSVSSAQLALTGSSGTNFDVSGTLIVDTARNAGFLMRAGGGGAYVCFGDESSGEITFAADSGATNIYTSSGASFSSGDTLRVVGIGTTFYIYHNGGLLTTETDSSHTSGIIGVTAEPNSGIEDFSLSTPEIAISSPGTVLSTTLLEYTPDTDFVGQDSFTFKVGDGIAESGAATVTLNVENPSDGAAGMLGVAL